MTSRKISEKLLAELNALKLLPEDKVDTSDAAEVADWKKAVRGAFYSGPVEKRDYDVRAIANWFLSVAAAAGRSITNLQLNKLVYFAVERALVEHALLLTPAKIEAWDHGPVFREIYHAVKSGDDKPIKVPIHKFSISERKMVVASESFLEEDVSVLKDIYEFYGHLSAGQLRNLSHAPGGPWDLVWNHKTRMNFGMEITPAIILTKARRSRSLDGRK